MPGRIPADVIAQARVAGIRVLRKQGRIGPDETGGAEFFVIVTPGELVAQVAVQPARTFVDVEPGCLGAVHTLK